MYAWPMCISIPVAVPAPNKLGCFVHYGILRRGRDDAPDRRVRRQECGRRQAADGAG